MSVGLGIIDKLEDDSDDIYFLAARVLAYQIMYASETRSTLPFHCLVTHRVRESKRALLRSDGFIIDEVEAINPALWMLAEGDLKDLDKIDRYQQNRPNLRPEYYETFSKPRVWQMTQYDRFVYPDGDMFLTAPLDPVLDSVEGNTMRQNLKYTDNTTEAEARQPEEYIWWTFGNGESRGYKLLAATL